MNKFELKRVLNRIPRESSVLLDLTRANYIDFDNVEIIHNFMTLAKHKQISVNLRVEPGTKTAQLLQGEQA